LSIQPAAIREYVKIWIYQHHIFFGHYTTQSVWYSTLGIVHGERPAQMLCFRGLVLVASAGALLRSTSEASISCCEGAGSIIPGSR
jgi:hypothetical protein